ncbi:hypothetical protein P389DRAFT_167938 [Cystobasidium minutum MCA 4210]|uniref:uncharacterized protein n=1 Tax=Cystobasidium minutum MCA 4210 TaxID=1397322 RepID=UPI0034CEEFB5|eukprot:jgi/Rhomi1/167938/fgenesh1_kg.2_\
MHHQIDSSADSLALPHLHAAADEAHRRYLLGGKKRLSRSAIELRPGSANKLHAAGAAAGPSSSSTPRGPTPTSTIRNAHNHPYRYSGALASTMRASTGTSGQGREHKTSRASLDLAVDIPLDHDDQHGPRPAFMDEDESSAHLGWSFATTPPLSPAEIVTYAEGLGSSSGSGFHHRRYSAGASNLFHSLDRKKSSGDMLQRKRRPSFPLMSLIDKAIRAPVAGMVAGMRANDNDDMPAERSPHSPDSDPSWGSPTPRESVALDTTATMHATPPAPPQLLHQVPLIPLPTANARRLNPQASISDLAKTPESVNDLLSAPPRLHDPARGLASSPVSSVGTPGTLSPDICNTNSTFSSPRSPSDELPTPKTAEFAHVDGNRFSQFSLNALSEGGMSFASDGSETVEAVNTKRQSKIFGFGEASMATVASLQVIPEDNDSPQKSVQSASSRSSAGASPKKSRPQSATGLNQSQNGGTNDETIQASPSLSQDKYAQAQPQGHKRQSSSLFRFPFISSLRNPFAASTAAPSIVTTASPNVQQSPSSSQQSPSSTSQELLSSEAIEAGFARQDTSALSGKRSTSPNSSEESHFLTPTDPPSPPRPGATSEASKGVDPSMLRNGPNTGKGRLSGLGLSFPSNFVAAQPRSVSHSQVSTMQQQQPHLQGHRQASLPLLSFSAASDEQHDVGSRSVESEEAAIHVIPDEHGYGRPVRTRNSSEGTQRSTSYGTRQRMPASAPATTVHFNHADVGLDNQMQQLHGAEFGARQPHAATSSSAQQQKDPHFRRPRTRLLSAQGLDLRGRIDRMRPSQLLFLAAFIAGPWCFVVGGWCLRTVDGDYRSVKGIRCRCPDRSDCCECQAEIYKQIKLSGGQVDRVLQSQNGEVRKMDRFVLANRVAALTCGTGTLVLAITALIVAGRTW